MKSDKGYFSILIDVILGCFLWFFSFKEAIEDLNNLFTLRVGKIFDLTESSPEARITASVNFAL
jgi:hypothetical protein